MKDEIVGVVTGKAALTVGIATASSPAWVQFLQGETFGAVVMLLGAILTSTLIIAGLWLLPYRIKNAKAEAALKKHQLKKAGIE